MANQFKSSEQEQGRIRWQCRRGMLELDLLLNKFVDQQYLHLSKAEQQIFERLLAETDMVLFRWFLTDEKPEDRELAAMVQYVLDISKGMSRN